MAETIAQLRLKYWYAKKEEHELVAFPVTRYVSCHLFPIQSRLSCTFSSSSLFFSSSNELIHYFISVTRPQLQQIFVTLQFAKPEDPLFEQSFINVMAFSN